MKDSYILETIPNHWKSPVESPQVSEIGRTLLQATIYTPYPFSLIHSNHCSYPQRYFAIDLIIIFIHSAWLWFAAVLEYAHISMPYQPPAILSCAMHWGYPWETASPCACSTTSKDQCSPIYHACRTPNSRFFVWRRSCIGNHIAVLAHFAIQQDTHQHLADHSLSSPQLHLARWTHHLCLTPSQKANHYFHTHTIKINSPSLISPTPQYVTCAKSLLWCSDDIIVECVPFGDVLR